MDLFPPSYLEDAGNRFLRSVKQPSTRLIYSRYNTGWIPVESHKLRQLIDIRQKRRNFLAQRRSPPPTVTRPVVISFSTRAISVYPSLRPSAAGGTTAAVQSQERGGTENEGGWGLFVLLIGALHHLLFPSLPPSPPQPPCYIVSIEVNKPPADLARLACAYIMKLPVFFSSESQFGFLLFSETWPKMSTHQSSRVLLMSQLVILPNAWLTCDVFPLRCNSM